MIEYYYEPEIRALNKSRIRYLVIGGVAVNLYGIRRLTLDLDLMIDLSEGQLEKFIETIAKLEYETRVPKYKWEKLTAIAFTSKNDKDKRIDVFLKNPMDFDKAYKKKKVFKVDNFRIPCISLEDLLKLKDKANRLRDWIDIGSLKRAMELKKKK